MSNEENKLNETIRKSVFDYNVEITSKESYESRRHTLCTNVIFFDDHYLTAPEFQIPSAGWCRIPTDLTPYLERANQYESIIRFDTQETASSLENSSILETYKEEIPVYLKSLVLVYLKLQYELTNNYELEVRNRVRNKIDELCKKIEENPNEILSENQIIGNISKILKVAKSGVNRKPLVKKPELSKVELITKAVKLRNEHIHTIPEICKLCGISKSAYYSYCRINDENAWSSIKPMGRPQSENRLTERKKGFIKSIVDDPRQSMTVPMICAAINYHFQHYVPKHRVYQF